MLMHKFIPLHLVRHCAVWRTGTGDHGQASQRKSIHASVYKLKIIIYIVYTFYNNNIYINV